MQLWNRKLFLLLLLATSPNCYSDDFGPKCYSPSGREVIGLPMVVDEAVLRIVSIDGDKVSVIGTSFYVGDFVDDTGLPKAGFLTAAHVVDDAEMLGNSWGLIACGNDKPEDVMLGVEILYRPTNIGNSDIAAIALKKTGDPFFESLGTKPLTISPRLLGKNILLGESAWWSGYSRLLAPTSPPTYNHHQWRSIPAETRYSLFSATAGVTPSGGASGSPVLRKTSSGSLEVIGVVALTPATATEDADQIIMKVSPQYPNIDRSTAYDISKSSVAASPLSPSNPALLSVIKKSSCEKSLIDAVQSRNLNVLVTQSRSCFRGYQPFVSAFRFIRWFEGASVEDQRFVLKARSSIQSAFERTDSSSLVDLFTTVLSKAESDGAGYAARLSSVEYSRSIFQSVRDGRHENLDAERAAITILETELYSALSNSSSLSEDGKKYVYSNLVDAYVWRKERAPNWQQDENFNDSPKMEAINLLCATELAPERSLAWDPVADLFMRQGNGNAASIAFSIKAKLSGDKSTRSTALNQCRSLSKENTSACDLSTPEALFEATRFVMEQLASAAQLPEQNTLQSNSCASAIAPLRDAKHRQLTETIRFADQGKTSPVTPDVNDKKDPNSTKKYADIRVTKNNTPGVNGEVDQAADTVVSGSAANYSVKVSNLGPDEADGSVLTDPAPTNATCTTASCSSSGGAECPLDRGAALVSALQAAGAVIPKLPAGGAINITLTCTVD